MGALTLSVTARSVIPVGKPVFSLANGNVPVGCDVVTKVINIIFQKALPRRVIYMH